MRSFASSSGATKSSQAAGEFSAAWIVERPSESSRSTAGETCSGLMSAKRGRPEKSRSGFFSCGSTQAVLQEHCDGHRADAAGHRRDPARDLLYGFVVHVARELAVGEAVHADVDYARPRFDHLGSHEFRPPDRRDKNVRLFRNGFQVFALRMTDGDTRILLQEEQREGLADDVRAPEDDGVAPG